MESRASLAGSAGHLNETLTIVTSKSGGTPKVETGCFSRGVLTRRQHSFRLARGGVPWKVPLLPGWLSRTNGLPGFRCLIGLADGQVGGASRSPAGKLYQGFDIDALIEGAMLCDEATRSGMEPMKNPAALLALSWYHATGGRWS